MADPATYPTWPQLVGSTEEWVDGVVLDRAVAGGVKARSFFTAKKRKFTLKHLLNATDRSTLQTLYNTNRVLRVTFIWGGDKQSYTCFFDGPPKYDYVTPTLAKVEVRLVEQ